MFRMPCIAIVSLFFAVPTIAQNPFHYAAGAITQQQPQQVTVFIPQNPATEPLVCLEATAVKIMLKAFQVGDHDTVEMLFDKLSLESKKKFLYEATELATIDLARAMNEGNSNISFAETMFVSMTSLAINDKAAIFTIFQTYVKAKKEQTQLLGRLTASLLGQGAVVAASQSEEEHYYHVVIQVTTDKEMSTRVERFPVNSNERVSDALGHVNFRDFTDDVRIWLARPAPCSNSPVILPVCLQDIASNGEAKTNHLLQPNDRLFVNVSPVADRRIIFLPGGQFGVWASGVIRTLR